MISVAPWAPNQNQLSPDGLVITMKLSMTVIGRPAVSNFEIREVPKNAGKSICKTLWSRDLTFSREFGVLEEAV